MVDVVWHAPAFGGYGYAKVSRNCIIELDRLGVNIYVKPYYLWDMIEPSRINPLISNRLKQLCENRVDEDKAITVSHLLAPSYVGKGRHRIGFTYWESDRLNPTWVKQMNEHVDEVWTGSNFCKQVFEASGVKKPVYVMPAGIDPEKFNHNVKPVNIKNRKGFTFLTVLDWGPRKNPHTLIRAYYKAFKENDDVCLFIKIWGLGSFGLDKMAEIRTIRASLGLKGKPPKIIWHTGYVHDDDLPRLYRGCDAFVLPTRGEGFCLPIMEAMASGLPVIATNWSGHTDYMNEWNAYPIRIKGFIPVKYSIIPHYLGFESRWAEPDEEHLAELMRYVYENREEARQRGLKGMKHVHRNFTWRKSGERIMLRLEEIENRGRSAGVSVIPLEYQALWADTGTERRVEYRWVWENLIREGRILDVGCSESRLSEVLANLGYEVWGIDIRPYHPTHPIPEAPTYTPKGWNFIQGDIRKTNFESEFFDQIIAVSTLEHIGLNAYGNTWIHPDGDRMALLEMYRILKRGGSMLITLPYGASKGDYWIKYYNKDTLNTLLDTLSIKDQTFYRKRGLLWLRCEQEEAEHMPSGEGSLPQAIVCVVVVK